MSRTMDRNRKVYSTREFTKILLLNGYRKLDGRGKGSHSIYMNDSGDKLTINNSINPMVARRLIKEHELVCVI